MFCQFLTFGACCLTVCGLCLVSLGGRLATSLCLRTVLVCWSVEHMPEAVRAPQPCGFFANYCVCPLQQCRCEHLCCEFCTTPWIAAHNHIRAFCLQANTVGATLSSTNPRSIQRSAASRAAHPSAALRCCAVIGLLSLQRWLHSCLGTCTVDVARGTVVFLLKCLGRWSYC